MTDAGWLGEQQAQTKQLNLGGPHYDGPRRRLAMLGKVASGLILAVATVNVFMTVTFWEATGILDGVEAGRLDPTVAYSDFLAVVELAENLDWVYLGALVAAAVVFLAWLWRARQNSELLSDGLHRRERGWVIGGWLVPFINFVFPYQVVRDIWRASNPGTRMTTGELSRARGGAVVAAWWACLALSWIGARIAVFQMDEVASLDEWRSLLWVLTVPRH